MPCENAVLSSRAVGKGDGVRDLPGIPWVPDGKKGQLAYHSSPLLSES